MPRTSSYSDFLCSYKEVAGIDEVDREIATNLNTSFRKHLRYGRRAARWPEHLVCEERSIVDGILPFIETSKEEIEVCWDVYKTNPYAAPYPQALRKDILSDGIHVQGLDIATSVWVKYLPDETPFKGSEFSIDATYSPGDVVFYDTDTDYYECLQNANGDLPTDEDYFKKLTFSTQLLDYLAHACHSDYLRKSDIQAADVEYKLALRYLANEQFMLFQAQGQSPAINLRTNNSQQNRR